MGTMRLLVFACVFGFGSILAEPDRDCSQIQRFVADYVRFLNQMPKETYPVNNFCSSHNTTKHYHDAVEWFEFAKGNESCAPDFNQNRLNVIQMLYDQMTLIWEAAHCEDCVSNSNETAHFMELYESQYNCTKKHNNPCEDCAGNYTEMQHFYEDLVHSRKGVVCFDIEDRMNQTRYAWSAKFNCCKGKQHSQEAFIWFASSISSLPVIFYLAMFFFTRRKEARERAMAPPLNDQAVGEQQPEEEPPQPSTSQVAQKQPSKATDDDDDDDDQCIADADAKEPKINNLNIVRGVRESRLIDLNDSGSENLQSEQDSKLPPVKGDIDDVSLLGARDLLH